MSSQSSAQSVPNTPNIDSITNTNTSLRVNFSITITPPTAVDYYVYSLNGGSDVSANILSTDTSFQIVGLTANTAYSVKIRAVNFIGVSQYSNIINTTTTNVPPTPTITSINASNQQLSINFSGGTNTGTAIVNYLYSLNGGADIPANTTVSPFTISGLTNGTTYSVRIKSVNVSGTSAYSNTFSETPFNAPSKPVITAISIHPKSLIVAFTSNTNGRNYNNVSYSLNGGSLVSASNTFSPIIINNLSENTIYSVAVRTSNIAGTSVVSDTSSVYLSNTFSLTVPTSVDICGNTFVMRLTDASTNAITYKYSTNGIYWSTYSGSNIIDTTTQNAVSWVGNSYVAPTQSVNRIAFRVSGNNFMANKLAKPSLIYNLNTNNDGQRIVAVPTELSTVLGAMLLPHSSL